MKKIFTRKTPKIALIFTVLFAFIATVNARLEDSTGAPASKTNAPGETNCTDGGCHSSFSLNPTPSNLNNLTLTGPFTGGGYIPDSVYSLTVSYSQSGISRFGFEITCLDKANNNPCGTFTAGTGSQKITGTVSSKTREYLTHNSSGTSGSGSKTWTFTWKAPSANLDSIKFYVVVNAANSDGSSFGDEIYAKTFTIGPSSLLPSATITTDKTVICAGDTVEFQASGTNSPTSYAWKFNGGTPSTSTAQTQKVVFANPGNFVDTLRVANNKGLSLPKTVTIKVNSKPNANITSITPSATVCQGTSVTLSAQSGSGFRYKWSTGKPGDTLQSVTVNQSGSYYVTVTNANGCSASSVAQTITVNPLPTVSLSAPDSACTSDSVTFTATAGFSSYTFSKNGTTVSTGTSNVFKAIGFSASDSFNVSVTQNGCTGISAGKKVKPVTPLQAPVITCGTSTVTSVTFNWTTVSGALGYTVSQDSGKTWITPSSGSSGTSHTVNGLNANQAYQLMVRATGTSPCTAGVAATKVCNSLSCSVFSYDLSISDTLICPGDSSTIAIKNLSLTKYSISFNGQPYSTQTSYTVKPTANSSYVILIIDSTKLTCPPAQDHANVKVISFPTSVTLSGTPLAGCQPVQVPFSANTGFDLYEFLIDNVSKQKNASNTYNATLPNAGQYAVVVKAGKGGCAPLTSSPSTVTVYPKPNVGFTFTVNNNKVDFSDSTSNSNSQAWNFGDGSVPGTGKTPSHTYSAVGVYPVTLVVSTDHSCVDSVTKQVTIITTGIDGIITSHGIKVFPNPVGNTLTFEYHNDGNAILVFALKDLQGRTLATVNGESNPAGPVTQNLDMKNYADGIYFLTVKSGNEENSLRIVKQSK